MDRLSVSDLLLAAICLDLPEDPTLPRIQSRIMGVSGAFASELTPACEVFVNRLSLYGSGALAAMLDEFVRGGLLSANGDRFTLTDSGFAAAIHPCGQISAAMLAHFEVAVAV